MKKLKNIAFLHGLLLTVGGFVLLMGLTLENAQAPETMESPAVSFTPPPAVGAAEQEARVISGCEVIQTMAFSRCGHSVTRRVYAPETLIGSDFAGTQAYYDLWQIETFSPERVEMRRELALFCPIHTVASVNEAGEVVLSRNMYGDGMAVVKETGVALDSLPDDTQSELLLGRGFDSVSDAEAWLREH